MWLAAAVVYSGVFWAHDAGPVVIRIAFLRRFETGLITVTVAFFLLEFILQRSVIPYLLPDGGLSAIPGTMRIRIRPRAPRLFFLPAISFRSFPFAVLVALFAATQYRVNRVAPDGSFLVDVGEHQDTALHVGLAFEPVAGYPPQVPGLAGVPLRYHVGAHLVRAAAVRWAGVHPYDLLNRLEITLWAAGLVLALRAVAQALEASRESGGRARWLPPSRRGPVTRARAVARRVVLGLQAR